MVARLQQDRGCCGCFGAVPDGSELELASGAFLGRSEHVQLGMSISSLERPHLFVPSKEHPGTVSKQMMPVFLVRHRSQAQSLFAMSSKVGLSSKDVKLTTIEISGLQLAISSNSDTETAEHNSR